MKKINVNKVNELEQKFFNEIDLDDDNAFYTALSEFETTAKVIKALEENDSVLMEY